MALLAVLASVALLFRGLGWLGVAQISSWAIALRLALAIMFCFAGVTHFTDLKNDYAAMIPDPLPSGMWVIYLTG